VKPVNIEVRSEPDDSGVFRDKVLDAFGAVLESTLDQRVQVLALDGVVDRELTNDSADERVIRIAVAFDLGEELGDPGVFSSDDADGICQVGALEPERMTAGATM